MRSNAGKSHRNASVHNARRRTRFHKRTSSPRNAPIDGNTVRRDDIRDYLSGGCGLEFEYGSRIGRLLLRVSQGHFGGVVVSVKHVRRAPSQRLNLDLRFQHHWFFTLDQIGLVNPVDFDTNRAGSTVLICAPCDSDAVVDLLGQRESINRSRPVHLAGVKEPFCPLEEHRSHPMDIEPERIVVVICLQIWRDETCKRKDMI